MLRLFRTRGRPRTRQNAPDQGTPELQRKREAKRKLLPHRLQAASEEIQAYLGGSHLHAFYLMGWISQEIFLSALTFTKIVHQAFRSMGLKSSPKSHLLPQHERVIRQPIEDPRAERLWHEISYQLKTSFQPRCYKLLMRIVTGAFWPSQKEVCFVLGQLHKVMQRKKLRSHH